jgi:hypothetical protein
VVTPTTVDVDEVGDSDDEVAGGGGLRIHVSYLITSRLNFTLG